MCVHRISLYRSVSKVTKNTIDQKLMTQGKIDLRNESGRPMKVKVVGEVSEE